MKLLKLCFIFRIKKFYLSQTTSFQHLIYHRCWLNHEMSWQCILLLYGTYHQLPNRYTMKVISIHIDLIVCPLFQKHHVYTLMSVQMCTFDTFCIHYLWHFDQHTQLLSINILPFAWFKVIQWIPSPRAISIEEAYSWKLFT